MGLCSYLLIGFWYFKPEAADACKKAFIVNRVGDMAFLMGVITIGMFFQTFDFLQVQTSSPRALPSHTYSSHLHRRDSPASFRGAVGKSAQFPLHVWLPDAMEGPTPVSALIHAATMVAAGVFMVARTFLLFSADPLSMTVVAWTGGFTALFAATIALAQNDIKRILAYSTISQLGYMIMALGAGGYTQGMFHLTTHACFKALLFLGAGSVIHGSIATTFGRWAACGKNEDHRHHLPDRGPGHFRACFPFVGLLLQGRHPGRGSESTVPGHHESFTTPRFHGLPHGFLYVPALFLRLHRANPGTIPRLRTRA